MSKTEIELLSHKINWEGFTYCFTMYSDWKGIKDDKFQEVRKAYSDNQNTKTKKALVDYLKNQGVKL